MRFLFSMDPAETMHPEKDTTFAFIEEATRRGHECFHCLPKDVGTEGREVVCWARPIQVRRGTPAAALGEVERLWVRDLDAVFIRKDPPFDAAYLYLTQVLELASSHTFIMNNPQALRDANEKLFALTFAEWMPETIVSSNPEEMQRFLEARGEVVLKPLDGAGGSSVVRLAVGDKNTRALIDILTLEGRRLAMMQRFEPTIVAGDKRVLLLDGALLGAIRRVPQGGDFRANIHVGGRVEATTLTPREEELVAAVGPELQRRGLYFVGLDLIAEKLIEVNVTSPTGLQELTRLSGGAPAQAVLTFVETQSRALRTRRAS